MIKLSSARVLPTETGNDENLQAAALSHGLCLLRVHGQEFEDMPVRWDWSLLPGSTQVAGRPAEIPWDITKFSPMQPCLGEYTGGVATCSGSLAVHDMKVEGLHVLKYWFAAHKGIASITHVMASRDNKEPVRTCVIAQNRRGAIHVYPDRNGGPSQGGVVPSCQAIWHDDVLWIFPNRPTIEVRLDCRSGTWWDITRAYGHEKTAPAELLEVWANTPLNTVLRWIAIPMHHRIDTPPSDLPLDLLSGDAWSACWWPGQQLLQLVFLDIAEASGPWGTVAVSAPVVLQIDRTACTLHVAGLGPRIGNVSIAIDGRTYDLAMPDGENKGFAVTLPL